jgi:hypothetical protein
MSEAKLETQVDISLSIIFITLKVVDYVWVLQLFDQVDLLHGSLELRHANLFDSHLSPILIMAVIDLSAETSSP